MNTIKLLILFICLFFIGAFGIFYNRKNLLTILISIELTMLSLNYIFLINSNFIDDNLGQIISLFILTIAAAESSIGLAILINYFRKKGSLSIELINLLKN